MSCQTMEKQNSVEYLIGRMGRRKLRNDYNSAMALRLYSALIGQF